MASNYDESECTGCTHSFDTTGQESGEDDEAACRRCREYRQQEEDELVAEAVLKHEDRTMAMWGEREALSGQ